MHNETDGGNPNQLSSTIILNIIMEAVLMIVVCFGNTLVIAAIHRCESLKTVTNYFIMHLAIADFCIGLIMPMHISMFLYRPMLENIYVCLFRYCSIKVTFTVSVLLLLAIAVDRHVSIVYPLRYHVIMTKTRARRIVIAIWVAALAFSLFLPMLWHNDWDDIPDDECDFVKVMRWEYLGLLAFPLFIINTLCMVGLYWKIFSISHDQATRVMPGDTGCSTFRFNLRIAKTASIVIGLFILCWYPFFIIMAIQIYADLIYSETWENWRSHVTHLAVANSAVNPIIYAFRMDSFRSEFKKLLKIQDSLPASQRRPLTLDPREGYPNEAQAVVLTMYTNHGFFKETTDPSTRKFDLPGSVDMAALSKNGSDITLCKQNYSQGEFDLSDMKCRVIGPLAENNGSEVLEQCFSHVLESDESPNNTKV